jgi:hypothetical protein
VESQERVLNVKRKISTNKWIRDLDALDSIGKIAQAINSKVGRQRTSLMDRESRRSVKDSPVQLRGNGDS